MGLDITAYEHFEMMDIDTSQMDDDQIDDLYDEYTHVYPSFLDQADGIPEGWAKTWGEQRSFRAGSYFGYNHWRRTLCEMAHGIDPDVLWENEADWKGKAFFEQINFSDAEGVIGPKTCAKLAQDYRNNREKAMAWAASQEVDPRWNDYFGSLYDTWMEAFELAANTGFVKFH